MLNLNLKSISYSPYYGFYTEERFVPGNMLSDIIELRTNQGYRTQAIDDVNRVMKKNIICSMYWWLFNIRDCTRKWLSLMLYAAAMTQVDKSKTKALIDTKVELKSGFFVMFFVISQAGFGAVSSLMGLPAQTDISQTIAIMDLFSWAKHLLGWYKDPHNLTQLLTERENLIARDNLRAHELTYATLRKKEYNYILENKLVRPECQINDEIRAHLVMLNYQFDEKSTINLSDVKKAYAKTHPDSQYKEGSNEAFQNAKSAYESLVEILSDPESPHATLTKAIADDTLRIECINLLQATS